MKIYQGKSVVAGTAIGTIRFYSQDRPAISPEKTADTAGEAARYERAKAQALKELEELCGKTAGFWWMKNGRRRPGRLLPPCRRR